MRVLWLVALVGCTDGDDANDDPAGFGDSCSVAMPCEAGLVCAGDSVCRANGEPGTAVAGDDCDSTAYCSLGLVCGSDGVCAEPGGPGTGVNGDVCNDGGDCARNLRCDGVCTGLDVPLWTGASCAQPQADGGPFRALYEVPGDEPLSEFYRFPFPNDARVQNGQIDLTGHPSPGALLDRVGDASGTLLQTVASRGAFGNRHSVTLRFSDTVAFETLQRGLPGDGTVGVVDLTEGRTYGDLALTEWAASSGRSQTVCHNRLRITPLDGRPWLPGHTYGAYVTTGVLHESGVPVQADDDFAGMLNDSPPSDERLVSAHASLQPFRDWLDNESIAAESIAVATVFTVRDPLERSTWLREAVSLAEPIRSASVVVCDGSEGPFANEEGRGCLPSSADIELQGELLLPRFQRGSPPFKTVADGGDIFYDGGSPVERTRDAVVFSLTLPDGPMPDAGWPLVLFGHSDGDNYQTVVRTGLAESLREVVVDEGDVVRFATLSWDVVQHGTRRNASDWDPDWLVKDTAAYDPDVLFHNPLNPLAASGNAEQAVADLFSVVRWARELDWTAEQSVTRQAVRFDASQLHVVAHGISASIAATAVAVEPDVQSVVLAGGGAMATSIQLERTDGNPLGSWVAAALATPQPQTTDPLVEMTQSLLDSADPEHAAVHLFANPFDGQPVHDVLQVYGVGDGVTPERAQTALARSLRVQQVSGTQEPLQGIGDRTPPVAANRAGGDATGVVALYGPVGDNSPHNVLFERSETQRQVTHFLATAVLDGRGRVVTP